MNFSISLILSVLAVSVYGSTSSSISGSSRSSSGCELSNDFSSGCDSSSSNSCSGTYLSSDASPRACAKELEYIDYQPCLPAVNYFKKLEDEVRANARDWFLESTRVQTATEFANVNGIVVRLYNAIGWSRTFPGPAVIPPSNDFSVVRSQALNKGVYDAGMDNEALYAFPLISPVGSYILVQFIVPRNKLPLNNINYKRKCLYY